MQRSFTCFMEKYTLGTLFLPARFATTQGVTKLFITYLEEVFLRGLLHLLKIYSSRVSIILRMKTLNSLGKAR